MSVLYIHYVYIYITIKNKRIMYDYEITYRTRDGVKCVDDGYGDHAQDAMRNFKLDYPTTTPIGAKKIRN